MPQPRPGISAEANDSLNQILASDAERATLGTFQEVDVAPKDMHKLQAGTPPPGSTVTVAPPLELEPSPRPLPKRMRHPVTPAVAVGRISVALGNLLPEDRPLLLKLLATPPLRPDVKDTLAYCQRVLAALDAEGQKKVLDFCGATEALR